MDEADGGATTAVGSGAGAARGARLHDSCRRPSSLYAPRMCDLGHAHDHASENYGFLVDTPEVRALVDETRRLIAAVPDHAARVEALRPAFAALLASDGWLPDACATPDTTSKMGGGIGQYALYRA